MSLYKQPAADGSDYSMSDAGSDNEEYLSLRSKYMERSKPFSDASQNGSESDDEDIEPAHMPEIIPAEDPKSARDAWGNKADEFYASEDSSSEDDGDFEALELQLQETRQIQQDHLSGLTMGDYYSAMQLLKTDEQEEEKAETSDLRDDGVALDILLGSLAAVPNTMEAENKVVSKLPSSIKSFAKHYEKICMYAMKESVPVLTILARRRSGFTDNLPQLSEGAIAYLNLQLQVALWYCMTLSACEAVGGINPALITHCETLVKAFKKVMKLRTRIGEDHFRNLRAALMSLESAIAQPAVPLAASDEENINSQQEDSNQSSSDDAIPEDMLEGFSEDDAEADARWAAKYAGEAFKDLSDAPVLSDDPDTQDTDQGLFDSDEEDLQPDEPRLVSFKDLIKQHSSNLEKMDPMDAADLLVKCKDEANAKYKQRHLKQLREATSIQQDNLLGASVNDTIKKALEEGGLRAKTDELKRPEPVSDLNSDKNPMSSSDEHEFSAPDVTQHVETSVVNVKKSTKPQKFIQNLVDGPRNIGRTIEANRGLTRKRKKYEGNARVHNRKKFAKKLAVASVKKLSATPATSSGSYGGESAGITTYVRRSQKL